VAAFGVISSLDLKRGPSAVGFIIPVAFSQPAWDPPLALASPCHRARSCRQSTINGALRPSRLMPLPDGGQHCLGVDRMSAASATLRERVQGRGALPRGGRRRTGNPFAARLLYPPSHLGLGVRHHCQEVIARGGRPNPNSRTARMTGGLLTGSPAFPKHRRTVLFFQLVKFPPGVFAR